MNRKRPIHPSSKEGKYFFICGGFTQWELTEPTPQNDAKTAADVVLKNWNINFSPSKNLVTDKSSKYFNGVFGNMRNFSEIKYSPRYFHTPWADGLVENQNKYLRRFIGSSSQQNVVHLSDQTVFYTFTQNMQTTSNATLSRNEEVFIEKSHVLVAIEFHLWNYTRSAPHLYLSILWILSICEMFRTILFQIKIQFLKIDWPNSSFAISYK